MPRFRTEPDSGPRTGPVFPLILFTLTVVIGILLERPAFGLALWGLTAGSVWRIGDRIYRNRMGALLGSILILVLAPIETDTSDRGFLILGGCFLAALLLPWAILRGDRGLIEYRIWPRNFRWGDLGYVVIFAPLAWAVIGLYFFRVNPDLPTHWPLPETYDPEAVWRLIIGINGVGIWDELFFVNTVFATLRSLYPARVGNLAQSVVYMSVLHNMAFTGIGPALVYLFALTQGSMYTGSRCLLYLLLVHLIVDAFLVGAILQFHYPETAIHWF